MKRVAVVCMFVLFVASSCATAQRDKTLTEAKEGMLCIRYEKGVSWASVTAALGQPDITPLPDPGTDLSKNTRIYMKRIVILSVERQEVTRGGRVRFQEIVTGLEVCKER